MVGNSEVETYSCREICYLLFIFLLLNDRRCHGCVFIRRDFFFPGFHLFLNDYINLFAPFPVSKDALIVLKPLDKLVITAIFLFRSLAVLHFVILSPKSELKPMLYFPYVKT